jgi:hypothetical protein
MLVRVFLGYSGARDTFRCQGLGILGCQGYTEAHGAICARQCSCATLALSRCSRSKLRAGLVMAAMPGPAAAAPTEAFLVPSRRGKDKLKLDGFCFTHRNTRKDGKDVWLCDHPGCAAKCASHRVGNLIFVREVPAHNHLANPDRIRREESLASAKREALQQPHATVTQCLTDVLAKDPEVPREILPTKHQFKRIMWEARAAERKKRLRGDAGAPAADFTSLRDLVLPPVLTSVDGAPFLLHDSGPAAGANRILMFATADTLAFLERCEIWLVDGTFRAAPSMFEQIYTFHGFAAGYTIPCIFALLPNKKGTTYDAIWDVVASTVNVPEDVTVLLDFEKAAYNAAAATVCEHNLGGCYFHFSQAVLRNLQKLGLSTKYSADTAFRLRVGRLRALAFLPEDAVQAGFYDIIGDWEPDERPLVDYFEKVWIGEPGGNRRRPKPPAFAHGLWNVHARALQQNMLTNNNAEAFHRIYKQQLQINAKPPLPACIENLQAQTRISHLDLANIALGAVKGERPATTFRTKCVANILKKYLADRDRRACLDAIAQLYRTDSGA